VRRGPGLVRFVGGPAVILLAAVAPVAAQEMVWGGSLRAFGFLRVDDRPALDAGRRDAELGILRLTGEAGLGADWRLTTHGVLTVESPPVAAVAGLAEVRAPTFLPLERSLVQGRDGGLRAEFDRLNLQGPLGRLRLVAGRQAITWGVNFFWPALDLFAPFRPAQIDRDYKPGVDAVRLTLPVGAFSEVEAVGAVLGGSLRQDGAAATLARIHLGRADVGLMGGYFHRDAVLGGFLTADVRGTGVRGEVSYTRSGDPGDAARGRERFWRASVGIDRLLTPVLTLTLEAAWNGFGVDDPALYPTVARADRVRRGEVTALGRVHAGLALAWELHPLWTLTNTALVNAVDGSALWVPTVRWSVADDAEVLFGAQAPLGPGPARDGRPRSEFGLAPATVFAGVKVYF
jgi:hypothetical protein